MAINSASPQLTQAFQPAPDTGSISDSVNTSKGECACNTSEATLLEAASICMMAVFVFMRGSKKGIRLVDFAEQSGAFAIAF